MLEVKNLAKSFGNRQILQNMNFSLKDGEILTVVGPSGAGKTTLLRIVAGLEAADVGSMRLDGENTSLARKSGAPWAWSSRTLTFSPTCQFWKTSPWLPSWR